MLNQGVHPTTVTFNVLLDELCKTRKMGEANKLYKVMILRGVQPNTYTCNIFMDGYCLLERIHDVKKLFVSMASRGCTPSVVSYNILINRYCKRKKIDNAMNLNREMISKGIRPADVTYNTLLIGLFITMSPEIAARSRRTSLVRATIRRCLRAPLVREGRRSRRRPEQFGDNSGIGRRLRRWATG
ncbi:hypothetical protein LWI28_013407 [Acer negundo]|uniref:Pentatricopeptide repeat-containing protein n=1 Tax=Acer negundo TaxID=4023 RepID=A0AAD5IU97_ACENE|nr:hypothetical protein LWI28_013407 [Acer negundo]